MREFILRDFQILIYNFDFNTMYNTMYRINI